MKKYCFLVAVVLAAVMVFASCAMAMTRDEIIAKAKQSVSDQGIVVGECNIVYDEGNKSWEDYGAYIAATPNDNNHGYLPHGILENKIYQAVYFDFYDDAKKDIWVFVDAETGDMLAVYAKK